MKTRAQLTNAIDRLHKQADDLRLCIGLGADDDYEALDDALAKIDRLEAKLADHDARQAVWRARHIAGLINYRARMKQAVA